MKAGDTAYLVESNRFVHEVEILRCNGESVSYTHLRAHETLDHLVCRLLLE